MIAVIADDITGAAEMAGIAHCLGLRVMLSTNPDTITDNTDVFVIATDTRSMTEEEAAAESARVASAVGNTPGVDHIFKKTDSALRGHVEAELEALISNTRYDNAIYLPANPSKGRIIRDGIYYIGGKPLHETDFSFDPEFPAMSSSLEERFPDHGAKNILFANATSEEDVRRVVRDSGRTTLLAGAADLFTAFLDRYTTGVKTCSTPSRIEFTDSIIVCGSTQSKPIDCGVRTEYMPTDVYDGRATGHDWAASISSTYKADRSVILAINDRHRTGHDTAVYLRETMAVTISDLIAVHRPAELIIEGGATAYAILSRLGWKSFRITDQIAPGVIRMLAPDGIHITMKPGSYPWGNLF